MKIRALAFFAFILIGSTEAREVPQRINVYRTFYCATGPGCTNPICGGNERTAWNRDARKAGGYAADPEWCPYGLRVRLKDGTTLIHDDNFGREQRKRDKKLNRRHIDIRIAGRTHEQVRTMGAGWIEVEVLP